MEFLKILEGKKTYIAALCALGLGIYFLSIGEQANAAEFFTLALGLAGLRHAIAKK